MQIARLEEQLREIEQEFERQMRARGFDPLQHEHVALTTSLAKLYNDRELLRTTLESLKKTQ